MTWLREAFPWLALAVHVTGPLARSGTASLLARISRRGAIPVFDPTDGPGIASAVIDAFVPECDVETWLRSAVPRWPAIPRLRAGQDFVVGFSYNPEVERMRTGFDTLPRRQRLWVRVGRSMRAVLEVQRGGALSTVALRAGFSDHRAMHRSMLRLLGVRPSEVAGAAGWEWLMWRFLCGQGQGKEKRWDQ